MTIRGYPLARKLPVAKDGSGSQAAFLDVAAGALNLKRRNARSVFASGRPPDGETTDDTITTRRGLLRSRTAFFSRATRTYCGITASPCARFGDRRRLRVRRWVSRGTPPVRPRRTAHRHFWMRRRNRGRRTGRSAIDWTQRAVRRLDSRLRGQPVFTPLVAAAHHRTTARRHHRRTCDAHVDRTDQGRGHRQRGVQSGVGGPRLDRTATAEIAPQTPITGTSSSGEQ